MGIYRSTIIKVKLDEVDGGGNGIYESSRDSLNFCTEQHVLVHWLGQEIVEIFMGPLK